MPNVDRISIEDAVRVGVALHKQGHVEEAAVVYRDVLEVAPDQPDALHFLGVLEHQMGNSVEGARLVEKALALAPDNAGMQLNFGNINREIGNYAKAEAAYENAMRLAPRSADAYCNLGALRRQQRRYGEARPLLDKAIELNPSFGEAYHNLGNLLRDERELDRAIEAYGKAVSLYQHNRGRGKASANLAAALRESGRVQQAEKVLREWLAREPGSATAAHMLAALTGIDVPERASNAYVRELFDGFANSFDEVLDDLRYRAPKTVARKLAELYPDSGGLAVLDAGCGTGLVGEALQHHAARLVGVDLSPVMLEKARARRVYDELIESEIGAYLAAAVGQFDLVVSVDTLCYFGNLADVLAAAAAALRPGGRLCCTLEKTEVSDGRGYQLGVHGRYAHQHRYVQAALSEAGFTAITVDDLVLRLEGGQPVSGMLFVATRG